MGEWVMLSASTPSPVYPLTHLPVNPFTHLPIPTNEGQHKKSRAVPGFFLTPETSHLLVRSSESFFDYSDAGVFAQPLDQTGDLVPHARELDLLARHVALIVRGSCRITGPD